MAGCPLTYEIGRIVANVEQALGPTETAVLTHSPVDGSLQLFTTDTTLHGQKWEIKLYRKSTYSSHANAEGVY